MAVLKEVKEYSGRQRINLNKSDGFNENEEVYIMNVTEYEQLKKIVIDFEVHKEKAISEKETAITTANETSKEVLQNIHAEFENIYKKQLEDFVKEFGGYKEIAKSSDKRFCDAFDEFRKSHGVKVQKRQKKLNNLE